MSGVRMYYIIRLYYLTPVDRKFSIGYVTSTVEINLAILTASVPALWPLARRWFPSMFSSLGIDQPYLEPDIEVAYATTTTTITTTAPHPESPSTSRKLTGKVRWQRKGRPPSYVIATETTDRDVDTSATNPSPSPGTNASAGGSSSNKSASRSSSWFDDGDDEDEDEEGVAETASHEYHQHVRDTEAELRRSPSSVEGEDLPDRGNVRGGIGIAR